MSENRYTQKKNDLDKLKHMKNELIDQNYRGNNELVETRKHIDESQYELNLLKTLIKKAKREVETQMLA